MANAAIRGAVLTSSYCSTNRSSTPLAGSHELADASLPTHLTRNSVLLFRFRLPSTRSTLVPTPEKLSVANLASP